MKKSNQQSVRNITNSTVSNVNICDSTTMDKYTIDEFIEKLQTGQLRITLDKLRGPNGALYVRAPYFYRTEDENWFNTYVSFNGTEYNVATTIDKNGEKYYQLAAILNITNVITCDNDYSHFAKTIDPKYLRKYCPFNKGLPRYFINRDGISQFELGNDLKPICKNRIRLELFKNSHQSESNRIDLSKLNIGLNRIITQLPSMEDKAIITDVYRLLKRLR